MQINVSQLLRDPVGATRDYQIDEAADICGDGHVSRFRGEVRMLRLRSSILAKGTFTTEVKLNCSRCLSQFRQPMTLNFEEEYSPSIDVASGLPLPRPEAGTFMIDEHHILDLTEAICQYTLLAIPMKPLCLPDCAGLCPGCGHNLNQGRCECSAESADPRWSALRKLLKNPVK